jgi:hypothetical protein
MRLKPRPICWRALLIAVAVRIVPRAPLRLLLAPNFMLVCAARWALLPPLLPVAAAAVEGAGAGAAALLAQLGRLVSELVGIEALAHALAALQERRLGAAARRCVHAAALSDWAELCQPCLKHAGLAAARGGGQVVRPAATRC